MEILIIIILLEFAYIIYKDEMSKRERKDLQLKLMSKDVEEYKKVSEPTPKPAKQEIDPYIPIEDVQTEKLMKAGDAL